MENRSVQEPTQAAASTDEPGAGQEVDGRFRRRVMLADGIFLGATGALQVSFELIGYYTGRGPLGDVFDDSPYTIGWVENHSWALLVGVLFLVVARHDARRFWHGFALAAHVMLAAANLTFWSSFDHFDVVPLGVGATAVHFVFIAAQYRCFTSKRWAQQPSR